MESWRNGLSHRFHEISVDRLETAPTVAWRKLTSVKEPSPSPLAAEWSPQYLSADISMSPHFPDDAHLDRSFQVYTQYEELDDDDDDELMQNWTPLEVSFDQVPTTLTAFDFDVNQITELDDLPPPNQVGQHPSTSYSFLVVISKTSPCEIVTTKYGKSVSLVKLNVADQSITNFEITCWGKLAVEASNSLQPDDIVYFEGRCSN
jgi:hypothetical protein